MHKGDLVRYVANIPDLGPGIVLEIRDMYAFGKGYSQGDTELKCLVHFAKHPVTRWVPAHTLVKI